MPNEPEEPVAMAQRSLGNHVWYQVCRRTIALACLIAYRLRFTGLKNIPQTGGVLIISNHQSHLDPPLVGVASRRRMNFVARKTLFAHKTMGRIIHSLGAIPIDRDGFGIGGIKETLRRLKAGEMVLIFPEGTRSHDGEIAAFRPGFTALAIRSKCSILPVAIDGAYDVWPRERRFPRLGGTIYVHFGEPITPEEIAAIGEDGLAAEIERRVRQCQAMLRANKRGGAA
jgi:1-acyl-sn-glycerol-3-phosphate acyltransferase